MDPVADPVPVVIVAGPTRRCCEELRAVSDYHGADKQEIRARQSRLLPVRADSFAPDARAAHVDARIAHALTYIERHCTYSSLRLEQVAREVNLSSWHFDRLLKAETGLSFKAQIRVLRMAMAVRLLETSFLSVKQIAAELGYPRASHFNRDFRLHYGTTPTYMRRIGMVSKQEGNTQLELPFQRTQSSAASNRRK